ncbi:MAG: ABC transporter permease [Kiritimatiellae bacterium]|nr:ABC transporter permease [Kiritimatiellia bacterium]
MRLSYFERKSFWYFFNPLTMTANLWSHRELIQQFAGRDVTGRYKGSFLGLFWSFLQPLIILLTYTFVFGVILKIRWPGKGPTNLIEFAAVMFCGMIAFSVFSECANRAPSMIVSNPNYVKKVVFPLEILPVSALMAALFHGFVSLIILLALNLVINHEIHATILLLPLVTLPLCFITLGTCWILASLGVFFRDLHQIIPLVTTVLFFLTPIFFSIDMVPAPYSTFMQFNPLSFIGESFRQSILWGTMPDWFIISVGTLFSAVFMFIGYAFFMRTKKGFADVI